MRISTEMERVMRSPLRHRSSRYSRIASSNDGIGAIPRDSIFAFDRAEYFGRRAAVRNSRSLVPFRAGFTPAAPKIFTAQSNQEIGVPPPAWNRPDSPV